MRPIYLLSLYRNPIQVSSDEVAVIGVSDHYAEASHVDPFGVSYYLGRPTMLFLAWGRLGELVGGLDLYHMRLLHALFGLLTIAACYALLRQLLPFGWAIFASAVVGACHSMFMISRLAMRENTSILVEVVALALLLWGLRNRHSWRRSGAASSQGSPSMCTSHLARLSRSGSLSCRAALRFPPRIPGAPRCRRRRHRPVGFVLVASPILIAEAKAPKTDRTSLRRTR